VSAADDGIDSLPAGLCDALSVGRVVPGTAAVDEGWALALPTPRSVALGVPVQAARRVIAATTPARRRLVIGQFGL